MNDCIEGGKFPKSQHASPLPPSPRKVGWRADQDGAIIQADALPACQKCFSRPADKVADRCELPASAARGCWSPWLLLAKAKTKTKKNSKVTSKDRQTQIVVDMILNCRLSPCLEGGGSQGPVCGWLLTLPVKSLHCFLFLFSVYLYCIIV